MKTMDLIVLTSTRNSAILEFQLEMLASFHRTTPLDRCQMWVIENNSTRESHAGWRTSVEAAGQRFLHVDTPFNMNRMYNLGTRCGRRDYVMYCNSDIVFHPGWYENLLAWYDREPRLLAVSPYSIVHPPHTESDPCRYDPVPRDELTHVRGLCGWAVCLPRSANFEWDERFPASFQDNDFSATMSKMIDERGIVCGIAQNSRVDHLIGGTYRSIPEPDYKSEEGRSQFQAKWGR